MLAKNSISVVASDYKTAPIWSTIPELFLILTLKRRGPDSDLPRLHTLCRTVNSKDGGRILPCGVTLSDAARELP